MSRIFDALKQASRARQNGNRDTLEEDWDILGTGEIRPSPTSTSPGTNATDVLAVSQPVADPWVISPEREQHHHILDQHRTLGPTAQIALDQAARIIPNAADAAVVEHYRRLRTKIMQQHAMKAFRSLLVTSASPQEGKTVTTLNIALSFAMIQSFRVLIVDGDLRRGSLGKWIGVADRPGLSNVIEGSAPLDEAVFSSEGFPMHFMVSGTSQLPAAELLHSANLSSHFQEMTKHFDLVLVDSPPVNLITDTQLLAANCDAVLLVARAFSTTRKSFERAVQDLAPFRVIGTVLNAGNRAHLYRRYKGYY
jgi:capsular exopolysaccharide synthesis family protein